MPSSFIRHEEYILGLAQSGPEPGICCPIRNPFGDAMASSAGLYSVYARTRITAENRGEPWNPGGQADHRSDGTAYLWYQDVEAHAALQATGSPRLNGTNSLKNLQTHPTDIVPQAFPPLLNQWPKSRSQQLAISVPTLRIRPNFY